MRQAGVRPKSHPSAIAAPRDLLLGRAHGPARTIFRRRLDRWPEPRYDSKTSSKKR